MEPSRFIDVIWKRLWLVVLATVLVGDMTFLLSVTTTAIYQATPTPARTPPPTPPVLDTPAASLDGGGDLVRWDTLAPVAIHPPGGDVHLASADRERRGTVADFCPDPP